MRAVWHIERLHPFLFHDAFADGVQHQPWIRGVQRRPNEEIVIFVALLPALRAKGMQFVFTDRHAYLAAAEFFSDLAMLDRIDWPILQRRDFRHDPDGPGKIDRYQAQALGYQHLPLHCVSGVLCYNDIVT
jgi:hypothetical protein